MAPFALDEEMEQMILRAATHVYCAWAQRALYQSLVSKAISDTKSKLPHGDCASTPVVDYGQKWNYLYSTLNNQELPTITLH